jgi:hypothetical protein
MENSRNNSIEIGNAHDLRPTPQEENESNANTFLKIRDVDFSS